MKMLTVENVSKSYVEKQLFQDISFTITESERIGIIGINGTGKSTLLKIIAGAEVADEGSITSSKDYSITFLSQQPELVDHLTVIQQLFHKDTPTNRVLREYERVITDLEIHPTDEGLLRTLYDLQQQMDTLQAWDANSNAKAILTKLGITNFHQSINELSGGQKKRVALAQCLVEMPDLLILDEPTNHLDAESIEWLEEWLGKYQGSLLFVTHDRYFLDRVSNRIIELDQGKLYSYQGNYTDFLEAKAIRTEEEEKSWHKHRQLFKQELEWMRKGAKARTTKQKARIQRFEQLEQVDGPSQTGKLDVSLSTNRLGKKVIEFINVSKSFDNLLLVKDFSHIIKPNDRIGIIGRNGTGKSTLLNMVAGVFLPDQGEIEIGSTVKIGYYTQENRDMDISKRMLDYVRETSSVIHTKDGSTISASQMLERFLFPPSTHGTPISKLSGGERRRLYLLKILMGEPNVLLLDEPTNDLDTETLTVLEDYLDEYPGVVISVSHDRFYLDKVVNQLLIVEGGGKISTYFGAYSDYLELKKHEEKATNEKEKRIVAQEDKVEKPKKRKLSYQEQKDWDNIEDKIVQLEDQLAEITKSIELAGSDYGKISSLIERETKLKEELDEAMDRWTYLSELVEELNQQ
ncbi:ATP-binding cassette subfamily F protein uup [Bacillus mesophilus]|uniref:ABC-F family ATP-binding cassette domain-containing protein n=1 Tax=Bacillus mesophilus TaxID=1808955 RepID=A0A6M0QCB3_9BACI|nr:ABC-F family ATP-binding cassette domain-containing protein [Bacillus mesophilus]MBM7663226.1 ATP-binding cassette subfamily F protein uup [Bacillus mesophilus]NEY73935.1 ABC-F family ATP-binding cassette domain-containing protein [Bacillus mesophilus]